MNKKGQIFYTILNLDTSKNQMDKEAWTRMQPLPFPRELSQVGYGIVDNYQMPIRDKRQRRLTYDEIKRRHPYDVFNSSTGILGASVQFQTFSDGQYIYVFRQSLNAESNEHRDILNRKYKQKMDDPSQHGQPIVNNTLLVDRYVLSGTRLNLTREIRYKYSGHKTRAGSSKDVLSPTDPDKNPFLEPTKEIAFVNNLQQGSFAVLQLPTQDNDVKKWQFFHFDAKTQKLVLHNLRAAKDGWFDTSDQKSDFIKSFFNPKKKNFILHTYSMTSPLEVSEEQLLRDSLTELIMGVFEAEGRDLDITFETLMLGFEGGKEPYTFKKGGNQHGMEMRCSKEEFKALIYAMTHGSKEEFEIVPALSDVTHLLEKFFAPNTNNINLQISMVARDETSPLTIIARHALTIIYDKIRSHGKDLDILLEICSQEWMPGFHINELGNVYKVEFLCDQDKVKEILHEVLPLAINKNNACIVDKGMAATLFFREEKIKRQKKLKDIDTTVETEVTERRPSVMLALGVNNQHQGKLHRYMAAINFSVTDQGSISKIKGHKITLKKIDMQQADMQDIHKRIKNLEEEIALILKERNDLKLSHKALSAEGRLDPNKHSELQRENTILLEFVDYFTKPNLNPQSAEYTNKVEGFKTEWKVYKAKFSRSYDDKITWKSKYTEKYKFIRQRYFSQYNPSKILTDTKGIIPYDIAAPLIKKEEGSIFHPKARFKKVSYNTGESLSFTFKLSGASAFKLGDKLVYRALIRTRTDLGPKKVKYVSSKEKSKLSNFSDSKNGFNFDLINRGLNANGTSVAVKKENLEIIHLYPANNGQYNGALHTPGQGSRPLYGDFTMVTYFHDDPSKPIDLEWEVELGRYHPIEVFTSHALSAHYFEDLFATYQKLNNYLLDNSPIAKKQEQLQALRDQLNSQGYSLDMHPLNNANPIATGGLIDFGETDHLTQPFVHEDSNGKVSLYVQNKGKYFSFLNFHPKGHNGLWIPAKVGQALSLPTGKTLANAVHGVELSKIDPSKQGFCMEAWLKPDLLNAKQRGTFLFLNKKESAGDSSLRNFSFDIVENKGKYHFEVTYNDDRIQSTERYNFNTWRHFAFSYQKYWGLSLKKGAFINCSNDISLNSEDDFSIEVSLFLTSTNCTILQKEDDYKLEVKRGKLEYSYYSEGTWKTIKSTVTLETKKLQKITIIKSAKKPTQKINTEDFLNLSQMGNGKNGEAQFFGQTDEQKNQQFKQAATASKDLYRNTFGSFDKGTSKQKIVNDQFHISFYKVSKNGEATKDDTSPLASKGL